MKWKQGPAFVFAAFLIFVPCAHTQTSAWVIDPDHSQATFQIRHMAVSTTHGSIDDVHGTIMLDEKDVTQSKVEATLATATVNTHNEQRDADLKSSNFFDVAQNPLMTFKSTSITHTNGKLKMTGDLTLNGITKSVMLDVDGPIPYQKSQNGKIVSGFSASGTIKRSDFHFGQKSPYSGLLGDEVKLAIHVEMSKQ